MTRIIGVLSGKGGVGKTTLVANLGVAFSQFGEKPLLIDANVKAPSLGLHLGNYEDLPITLKEFSEGEYGVYKHPLHDLWFLPAPIQGEDVNLRKLGHLLEFFKGTYDPILVDFAPAFSQKALESLEVINQALLVTTPRTPAVTDIMRAIKILKAEEKEILGIVMNKAEKGEVELSKTEVEENCEVDVIAEIPRDKRVIRAVEEGKPVVSSHPYSKAAIEIKKLASRLLNKEWEPPGIWKRLKNLFSSRKSRYYTKK